VEFNADNLLIKETSKKSPEIPVFATNHEVAEIYQTHSAWP